MWTLQERQLHHPLVYLAFVQVLWTVVEFQTHRLVQPQFRAGSLVEIVAQYAGGILKAMRVREMPQVPRCLVAL